MSFVRVASGGIALCFWNEYSDAFHRGLLYKFFAETKQACRAVLYRKGSMKDEHPELPQEPEWAAYVAIDWADQKHVWKLQPAGQAGAEEGELEHTPEAIDAWAS